jgi:nucleotide-binding universal stress UspA family protein
MFKHILLPTDGSALSEAAIQNGIKFAKSINARVTGLHVIPPFHFFTARPEAMSDTKEAYQKDSLAHAQQLLAVISQAAKEAGVPCDGIAEKADHPYEAIIAAAEKRGCDLILMASHGRRGVKGLLIGSETHKVLTHTKIPVLVFR